MPLTPDEKVKLLTNFKPIQRKFYRDDGKTFFGKDIGIDDYEDYLDRGIEPEKFLKVSDLTGSVETLRKTRALYQGDIERGWNATVSGIGSGILTAVEDLSYLFDFDHHLKALQGIEDYEKNWLAELTTKGKESLGEAFPIYKVNPDDISIAEMWKGILDSAIGFGLPAGIVGKGVSMLGKGLKITKGLQRIGSAVSRSKLPGVQKAGQKLSSFFTDQRNLDFLNSVPTAVLNNYAESRIMAIESMEITERELEPLVKLGVITKEEAKRQAIEAHDRVMLGNKAMIVSNFFETYGILKLTKGLTRTDLKRNLLNLSKDDFLNLNADNLILQSGREYAEEVLQGVLQRESEYRSVIDAYNKAKDAGKIDSLGIVDQYNLNLDYDKYLRRSENLAERLWDFATDKQTQIEGLMGFFGGGPQRVLMNLLGGKYSKRERDFKKQLLADRELAIKLTQDFLKNNIAENAALSSLIDKIKTTDDPIIKETLIDKAMTTLIAKHIKGQSVHLFEDTIQEILNGELTQKQKELFGDKDPSTIAANLIEKVKELEAIWLKYSARKNQAELFHSDINIKRYNKLRTAFKEQLQNDVATVEAKLNEFLKNKKELKNLDATIEFDADKKRFKIETNSENISNEQKQIIKEIEKQINESNLAKSIQNGFDEAQSLDEELQKAIKNHENLLTDKAEKDYLKKQESLINKLQKVYEKIKNGTPVPTSSFKDFSENDAVTDGKNNFVIDKIDHSNQEIKLTNVESGEKLTMSFSAAEKLLSKYKSDTSLEEEQEQENETNPSKEDSSGKVSEYVKEFNEKETVNGKSLEELIKDEQEGKNTQEESRALEKILQGDVSQEELAQRNEEDEVKTEKPKGDTTEKEDEVKKEHEDKTDKETKKEKEKILSDNDFNTTLETFPETQKKLNQLKAELRATAKQLRIFNPIKESGVVLTPMDYYSYGFLSRNRNELNSLSKEVIIIDKESNKKVTEISKEDFENKSFIIQVKILKEGEKPAILLLDTSENGIYTFDLINNILQANKENKPIKIDLTLKGGKIYHAGKRNSINNIQIPYEFVLEENTASDRYTPGVIYLEVADYSGEKNRIRVDRAYFNKAQSRALAALIFKALKTKGKGKLDSVFIDLLKKSNLKVFLDLLEVIRQNKQLEKLEDIPVIDFLNSVLYLSKDVTWFDFKKQEILFKGQRYNLNSLRTLEGRTKLFNQLLLTAIEVPKEALENSGWMNTLINHKLLTVDIEITKEGTVHQEMRPFVTAIKIGNLTAKPKISRKVISPTKKKDVNLQKPKDSKITQTNKTLEKPVKEIQESNIHAAVQEEILKALKGITSKEEKDKVRQYLHQNIQEIIDEYEQVKDFISLDKFILNKIKNC